MNACWVATYGSVWHGGAVIGSDNEINGITFAGVGSGTTVDHIEVAFNLDDGVEFFGGTVNVKYLSVLFVGDDSTRAICCVISVDNEVVAYFH